MSEDALVENVETDDEADLPLVTRIELCWDLEALERLGVNTAALARAVLPIVEDHAKAERKVGAVDALREVEKSFTEAVDEHHEVESEQYEDSGECPIDDEPWPCTHAGYCLDAAKLVAAHIDRLEAS